MRVLVAGFAVIGCLAVPANGQGASRDRAEWIAFARGGFALSDGRTALDVLLEMNALLASPDPILRDEVAFSAAEPRILHERRLTPDQLRRLLQTWTTNLDDGLGDGGGRPRVQALVFRAEPVAHRRPRHRIALSRGVRGAGVFRSARGFLSARARSPRLRLEAWVDDTVAHTADVLKFLAHNPRLAAGSDTRLLAAVRAKLEASDVVFAWGENDRVALALHSILRRDDADPAAVAAWIGHWVGEYRTLWAGGPHVDARQFARVENARQVLRSLFVALSTDEQPTPNGTAARKAILAAVAKMR